MKLDIKKIIMREEAVYRKMEKGRATALNKSGALIRKAAQRSMRKPNKPYREADKTGYWFDLPGRKGKPPLRWANRPKGAGLYNLMLYVYSEKKGSVVVGPEGFGNTMVGRAVPGLVEEGGLRTVPNPRRRIRKIGSGGEMRVSARMPLRKSKGSFESTSVVLNRFGNRRYVSYGYVKTQRQAARANKLNTELYGPKTWAIHADKHEFMGPTTRNPQIRDKIVGFFGG